MAAGALLCIITILVIAYTRNSKYEYVDEDKSEFESVIRLLDKKHLNRTKQLIGEHGKRIRSGADRNESYTRLIGELKCLVDV